MKRVDSMLDEKRLQRIREMAERMNALDALYARASALVEEVEQAEEEFKLLEQYYYGAWQKDYQASCRGEVPENVPQSVLSEDLSYETLTNHDELGRRFLAMAYKMLCSRE